MDVGKYLAKATDTLQKAGVETARLDVLVLLEDVLGTGRGTLLAHPETVLADPQLTQLNNYVSQRSLHWPLAYIRGKAMFYGREFMVNKHVLVPRPETEAIIDCLKSIPLGGAPRVADVGTGSGCIGITAALELFGAEVFLYDIDAQALAVAKKNAMTRNVTVRIEQRDLLQDVREQFDVVLTNLPYVPEDHPINDAAAFEPKLALFSGADGLDHYRRFWEQLATMPGQPTHVLTESMPKQHQALAALGRSAGYALVKTQDYVQQFVRLSATED